MSHIPVWKEKQQGNQSWILNLGKKSENNAYQSRGKPKRDTDYTFPRTIFHRHCWKMIQVLCWLVMRFHTELCSSGREKVSPRGTIRTWRRNRLWEHLENFLHLNRTPWSLNISKFRWSHWKCQSKVQNPWETIINLAFPVHMEMLILLIKEKYRKALTIKNRNPKWIKLWIGPSQISWIYCLKKFNKVFHSRWQLVGSNM